MSKNYFQGLPSPAAAALVCGFVWLGVEGKLPEWLLPYQSEIAAVVTLYAGLTMVSNAPFFSGKSYAVVRTIPFWFVVVFALLFIVISSNTSLSVFVLFCIYALSGFAYGFYCWWTGRPNPIQPTSPPHSRPRPRSTRTRSTDLGHSPEPIQTPSPRKRRRFHARHPSFYAMVFAYKRHFS